MVTKGIIKRLNELGDNHFLVYIPLLRTASDTEEEATFQATLCCFSGIYNSLKVGDVVFVEFEDNLYNKPVILGKLFLGDSDSSDVQLKGRSLTVSDTVQLPDNTKIGKYEVSNLLAKLQEISED